MDATSGGEREHMASEKRAARSQPRLRLTRDEARALLLIAQGIEGRRSTSAIEPTAAEGTLPGTARTTAEQVLAEIDRLGVVQIDTINVVERSQYVVLWSRLGQYNPALLNELLYPRRAVFEYWGHAASIVPMRDYPYYRPKMQRYAEHMYGSDVEWAARNPQILAETKEALRRRGPLASADFERPPDAQRTGPWDWYGAKESRRALEVLWTIGDVMIYRRRPGGQKVYGLREQVLKEAFGRTAGRLIRDERLPDTDERLRYFARRTASALGVLTPAWLWDYFRLRAPEPSQKKATALALLDELVTRRVLIPVEIDGIPGPAYLARERLPDLERYRAGERPTRTTLLTPFDSILWDRARARALFDYEVCFEAYVVPEKRRYGYYCLAILHCGRLVGRLDAKMDRAAATLVARAVYLESGILPDDALADGIVAALRDLARFLGGTRAVLADAVRCEPTALAALLSERLEQVELSA